MQRVRAGDRRPHGLIRTRLLRLLCGKDSDPAWIRPCLIGLLVGAAVLYLWRAGATGQANVYYTAAVHAATKSWKAFFFGSFDASNFITVDKPPASLWVMALSARMFGVNAWSILVPQALMGVAVVGIVYAMVRRAFSPAAGLIAGGVLALTPVAALLFRYNNPDALFTLLLVAAAYALTRALRAGSMRLVVVVGVLVGFAFLTKMLQALIVIPAFAFVYLESAPVALRRKLAHLAVAAGAMVAAAGWWFAIVALWPRSSRPYIGGSQTNSILELTFGYNGLGRLTGNEPGGVVLGLPGTKASSGPSGITRLFDGENGGQVAWLIPPALIFFVALVLVLRVRRTDHRWAAVLLWGGWLLTTGLTFSAAQGIFHPYYNIVLAPPVAGLVGIGGATLWRRRERRVERSVLAATVAFTSLWSFVLLGRSPAFVPWLRMYVLAGGMGAAWLIYWYRFVGRLGTIAAGIALLAALAGPAAYSLATAATPQSGGSPAAGPSRFVGDPGVGRTAGAPVVSFDHVDPTNPGIVRVVTRGGRGVRWAAAMIGAPEAGRVQLDTDLPVMAIGGFNGSDPAPTLDEFRRFVRDGKVRYFIGGPWSATVFGGQGSTPGSTPTARRILHWVRVHFDAREIGIRPVYDLRPGWANRG